MLFPLLFLYIPLVSTCLRTFEPDNTVLAAPNTQVQSVVANDNAQATPALRQATLNRAFSAQIQDNKLVTLPVESPEGINQLPGAASELTAVNKTENRVNQSLALPETPKTVMSDPVDQSIDGPETHRTAMSDYQVHRALFRNALAKTFISRKPAPVVSSGETQEEGSGSSGEKGNTVTKVNGARTFLPTQSAKNETSDELIQPNIDQHVDMFQALSVPEPDMCGSCPSIILPMDKNVSQTCANWESISRHFYVQMDERQPVMTDQTTIKECTRTMECSQPYAIVKWLDFPVCDVHTAEVETSFSYQCNGTHWLMHGFPIQGVHCAFRMNNR